MDDLKTLYLLNQSTHFQNVIQLEKRFSESLLATLNESVSIIFDVFHTSYEEIEQDAINKFCTLYADLFSDNDLIRMTKQADENVNYIIEQLEANPDAKIDESGDGRMLRLALATYQNHLESVPIFYKFLKDNLDELLTELQFHDMITQIIKNLHSTFLEVTDFMDALLTMHNIKDNFEFGPIITKIYRYFTSERERKIFLSHFKRILSAKSKAPPLQLSTEISALMPIEDFFDQYINFYKKLLLRSNKLAEQNINKISDQLNSILKEANRLSNYSSDSMEAFKTLHGQLLVKHKKFILHSDALTQLIEKIHDIENQFEKFTENTKPMIESLQFQDRIQQNMTNFAEMLFIYQQTLFFQMDEDILNVFDPVTQSFRPFGKMLLGIAKMESERKMIKEIFFIR